MAYLFLSQINIQREINVFFNQLFLIFMLYLIYCPLRTHVIQLPFSHGLVRIMETTPDILTRKKPKAGYQRLNTRNTIESNLQQRSKRFSRGHLDHLVAAGRGLPVISDTHNENRQNSMFIHSCFQRPINSPLLLSKSSTNNSQCHPLIRNRLERRSLRMGIILSVNTLYLKH